MKLKSVIAVLVILFTSSPVFSEQSDVDISFYTGTFDVIDKEGDDQTNLIGIEHKNPNLFRDTVFGKFKPITGAFITGDSSIYLYTGIEGQYQMGPLKILPRPLLLSLYFGFFNQNGYLGHQNHKSAYG